MTFREELTEKFDSISNQLSPEQTDAAFEELLSLINARFETPVDAAEISKLQHEVAFFLDAKNPSPRYLHELPDHYSDLTVSIFVFWILVTVQKVSFRPRYVPAFHDFAVKFSNVLIH